MSPATYTITSPPNPGLTPPPGVIPNFDQPYTLLPYVELTIVGGIAISSVLIAARVFVKARLMKKGWLWEDYTCIAGWVSSLILFFSFDKRRITNDLVIYVLAGSYKGRLDKH